MQINSELLYSYSKLYAYRLFIMLNISISLNGFGQSIKKIEYTEASTSALFPKKFIIELDRKRLITWNYIDSTKFKVDKIQTKPLQALNKILVQCRFDTIPIATLTQIDGGQYTLKLYFSNDTVKCYNAWSDYRSGEFLLFSKFIKEYYRNRYYN